MSKGPQPHPLALARKKYSRHRAQAKFRGIGFAFSFEDWYEWWLNHGVDKNTTTFGGGPDRLCMCRYGDTGDYTWDNVYCATHVQNVRDRQAVRDILPPRLQRRYRLGSQTVDLYAVRDYLDNRGLPHSLIPLFRSSVYEKNLHLWIQRYLKRFTRVYGTRKNRTWHEGRTACWRFRVDAASDWGISTDQYCNRQNKNLPGYRKALLGDVVGYINNTVPFPDAVDTLLQHYDLEKYNN